MRHPWFGVLLAVFALSAVAADDIVLRGMGSFHVGGRIVEVNGKPVRMIVRQPGGPPGKLDPNGQYMVEQMYVQYFLPKHRKGKLPLLMWHGGGLSGATYETKPDGGAGVTTWSGEITPTGTMLSALAMTVAAAIAITGLKLRAVSA